ncbi:WxcM-like domain-containing protein [Niabella insulamsoli]|uniref:WxcM-like domain-containing protein n=1 Tax=Niabella insulamsoli TaxID=3144874 RepID=UPI0031FC72F5
MAEKQINRPQILSCDLHNDKRGTLTFANKFDMRAVKRFYMISHPSTKVVRAWQGHKVEQKWFFVIKGRFHLNLVEPDDWAQPSENLKPEVFDLDSQQPSILYVPGGFATGFKALEPESQIMVFSDCSVEESRKDDYRFDDGLWVDWHNC